MKKLLLTSLAAAALSLASLSASAASVTGDFNVTVTLNPLCKSTSTLQTLAFGPYDAITQATDLTATAAITFDCTRGLAAPVVSFDNEIASSTTYGVLAGLNYKVVVATPVTSGGASATANAGVIGSAKSYSYGLTGTMLAGQAGDCAGANAAGCNVLATSTTRTLKLTY